MGFNLASADARAAISKIFETKISSQFEQIQSLSGSETILDISNEIKEETESILSGITIKYRYEDTETVYVFATLDKRKAAKALRDKIKKIDEEMKVYSNEKNARSLRKLEKLLIRRDIFNARYSFLKGGGIPAPVTLKEIIKRKNDLIKGLVIAIDIEAQEIPQIKAQIRSALVELGYSYHEDPKQKMVTHLILGSVTYKKQYLKVEGFEKYNFLLDIHSLNVKKGIKEGVLQHSIIATGRDFQQAKERALVILEEFINENIADLNIEK